MELDNVVAQYLNDHPRSAENAPAPMARFAMMAVAACFTLTACSSVPDAVNPVEWYKGTADFFTGEDEETPEADKPELPGEKEEEYPNLSSVPQKPATSSAAEREQIAEGLIADNQNARYTDNPAASREAPRRSLNAAPATPAPPAPPAPVAAPSQPVQSQAAIPAPPAPAPAAIPTPPQANAPRLNPPLTQQALQNNQQFSGQSFDVAAGQNTLVISSNSVNYGSAPAVSAPASMNIPAGSNPLAAYAPAGQTLHLATIQFANGSANLSSRDRQILSQVAQIAAARGGVLRVVGHASQRTQDMNPARHSQVNDRISAARANSVAQAIINMGVPAQRLYVGGAGASDPRYLEVMPSGEAGNRRAEIYIDL